MKWEKALKYTRKHKRMIAVMMAGVIGFACFYSADASVRRRKMRRSRI